MAITPYRGASALLELAGLAPVPLRSLQPAPVTVQPPQAQDNGRVVRGQNTVVLGEMAAELNAGSLGPVADWVRGALQGKDALRDGAALVTDRDYKLVRRIGFIGAQLTRVQWPTLDASSKLPFTLQLQWQPTQVIDKADAGAIKGTIGATKKQLLLSNFRVSGLPFDASGVLQLALPRVTWASAREPVRPPGGGGGGWLATDLGEVELTLAGRSLEPARAWVQQAISDGAITGPELLACQVELLDASLKKAQGSFTLRDLLLLGASESPIGTTAESLAKLTLRFAVGGMDFVLP